MNYKYKILVADDSELAFKIITEILKVVSSNYELFYAPDGVAACNMAFEIIPDLILMDVIMPEMNGIEAVKKLKNDERTRDIPMIVLSATESLDSAYEAGANDFISKPFNNYELLIKVRSALNLVQKIKEIKYQKGELEKKHEEVIKQRDEITFQKKEIIEDIKYSKRIQSAILPTADNLNEIIPEHFIFDLPKNIVSGDFYWVGKTAGKKRIVAVADCTGHGISGAFMTMVGIAFLNEILSKKPEPKASEILFDLRNLVMKLLKQKGEEGEAADGMDISLVIIDDNKNILQFAGANNPLYIVSNKELTQYKGYRMPIGIHLKFKEPFTDQHIPVDKEDMIYMFTDGYADQFGGPHNKKFRYKQFQDMLLEIYNHPLGKQNDIIHRRILDWMGDNKQVDDILVLGFRI
ncbi:MAG: response regulator [Bacteroidales bacterium]|nr:response regulator [Bacteroidales bacterium]